MLVTFNVVIFTVPVIWRIAAIPIQASDREYTHVESRGSSSLGERDSGFGVYSCGDVKTYSITSQTGPYNGTARLAGAQSCVANNAGVGGFTWLSHAKMAYFVELSARSATPKPSRYLSAYSQALALDLTCKSPCLIL